jgi:hypothetical protein
MRVFNEQFKQLLSMYPTDSNCSRALKFIEQSDEILASGAPIDPQASKQATTSVWDPARVKKFIAGLRFTVKKRNAYFGYLLDKVKIVVVDPKSKTFKTMAVDGKTNLYINPEFAIKLVTGVEAAAFDQDTIDKNIASNKHNEDEYNSLPPGEKVFLGIIAHELMHIFKDHVARMGHRTRIVSTGGRPISLWNIATDIEINDELLYKWGYYIIKNGIITKPDGTIEINGNTYDCRGKTPERIYAMLENDIPPNQPPPKDTIEVGDVVYDKTTKKYGEVVSISSTGEVQVEELTKAEAKARA